MPRGHQRLRPPWQYAASTWPDGPFDTADPHGARAAAAAARIAKLLRRHRGERLWSRPDVARRAGVSAQTVGNLETGRVWPDLATLVALADALDVQLHVLVRGLPVDGEPPAHERDDFGSGR